MTTAHRLHADELHLWENLYRQAFTIAGQESIVQQDGSKQLVFLPMMTYTLISTMLQKLKYLPNRCFNRMVIGDTPICGLRPLDRASPPLMHKLTDILRTIVDGVRKQHVLGVTMIFYQKDNIDTIYDAYSLVIDYSIQLPENEPTTSIHMIAHITHQIEYMFSWNDALPDDVELTFVLSALDQFDDTEEHVPKPFRFVKQKTKNIYVENETNQLLGRLETVNGKIWLKFLPNMRQLSGSSIHSDELPTRENMFTDRVKTRDISNRPTKTSNDLVTSSKSKKTTAMKLVPSNESNQGAMHLPSSAASASTKSKKKGGLFSAVRSLITPSRTPAPVTSSTPTVSNLVLIPHTSTPKPGETASRITLGDNGGVPPLSAIYEVSTPDNRLTSPTPSTITATDMSTEQTPTMATERRQGERAPTMRGQAAAARKKIAAMQIRDDEDENDEEQFQKLFSRRRSTKSKYQASVPVPLTNELSEVSSISSITSAMESVFTPPSSRKRPTTDLVAEHGTPPKTPRTGRRNRIDEQSTPIQPLAMDITDLSVNVDSPRLLRSATKKLQQQRQAPVAKQLQYEGETTASDPSMAPQDGDRVFVNLERASIALHYSMDESD